MLVIRPVKKQDIDDVSALADLAGAGMTSLPQDRQALSRNIETAVEAFERGCSESSDYFLMVLEDLEKNKVVGTAAVSARTGTRQAFYAYRLMSVTHYSHSLSREIRSNLLHLTNDYTDFSEMGTLFLHPDYRGNGHWLSRSRYMLLALFPDRFAEHVIAELRGWLDEDGASPFWNAIGEKFFAMDYAEADRLCGVGSNQFITELMPKYPIYTNLLPETAVDVIGKPHKATRRAMELLLEEGFEYENVVDVFDGGPVVKAKVEKLRSVLALQHKQVILGEPKEDRRLLANTTLQNFAVTYAPAEQKGEQICLSKETAGILGVNTGDTIAVIEES